MALGYKYMIHIHSSEMIIGLCLMKLPYMYIIFPSNEYPVFINIDQDIHIGRKIIEPNEKCKNFKYVVNF